MSRLAHLDDLIAVLARYGRIKERLAQTKLKTPEGIIETAAFQCMFKLETRPLRSGELAEQIFADPSTVSRHIAHLVALGYVRREADPDDGRATILVLTDDGRRQVAAVRAHRRHALTTMLDSFTDDEIDSLTGLMSRFVDAAEGLASEVDPEATTALPPEKNAGLQSRPTSARYEHRRHEEATR